MTAEALGSSQDLRPRNQWLPIARVAWVALAVLMIAVVLIGTPGYFRTLLETCTQCTTAPGAPGFARSWTTEPITGQVHAIWAITFEYLLVASFMAVATVLYRRKGTDPLALLTSFWLLTFCSIFTGTTEWVTTSSTAGFLAGGLLRTIGGTASFTVFYLFPSGTFVPRWTRWAAAIWTLGNIVGNFVPQGSLLHEGGPVFGLFLLIAFPTSVGAQIYRFRKVSDAQQRQQAKWMVLGFALGLTGLFLDVMLIAPYMNAAPTLTLPMLLLETTWFYCSLILIPLSVAFAILRYRLWEIDLLINRALVYGLLTTAVILLYVFLVGYLGVLFRTEHSQVISLAVTGLIAVLFQPLRERLQRSVNHLLYGQRDEPYAVLSLLSQRLQTALDPGTLLGSIVEVLAQALKLPYAAIAIRQEDGFRVAATHGAPPASPITLPLVYQTEQVGQLHLATRRPGEPFTPADERLIAEVARQAGAAVNAVRLADDLQRSNQYLSVARERLVNAREEERRRLRHDLHDGLSPALAAFTLKIGAIRRLMHRKPEAAEALLGELSSELDQTIADVRRMVQGLRPPALDQLGLLGALHARAAQFAVEGEGLHVAVDAPEHLPTLPAAVEVAAYLVAQEALTNVSRHADVSTCLLRLHVVDAGLSITVEDRGRGLPSAHKAGVGLLSMRERCAELGGTWSVTPMPDGGTRVSALLPFTKE